MKPRLPVTILLLLAVVSVGAAARAESASGLVERGNQAYAAGKMDEAMAAYDKALEKAPDAARIYFNKGCALYRQKSYDKAADMFNQAAMKSDEPALEAKSHFNLGNSMLQKSRSAENGDLQGRMETLEKSIRHYEQALDLDPSLDAAGHNLELSRRDLKKLREAMQKQQQMAKNRQQQQEQMQQELKDLIDRQESMAESTQQAEKEQAPQSGGQDRERQLADQQSAIRQETGKLADKQSAAGLPNQDSAQAIKEQLKKAMEKQAGAEADIKRSDFEGAKEKQKQAADEMKEALAQMQKDSEKQSAEGQQKASDDDKAQEQEQAQAGAGEPPKAGETGDETGSSAAIGSEDPEKILQEEQQHRQYQPSRGGAYHPVEKDW